MAAAGCSSSDQPVAAEQSATPTVSVSSPGLPTEGTTQLDVSVAPETSAPASVSEQLCALVDVAAVEQQLSAAVGTPIGTLTAVADEPYGGNAGQAQYIGSCSLTTAGERPFTVPGCVVDAREVGFGVQDFSYGPLFEVYPGVDGGPDQQVGGTTATEYTTASWENRLAQTDGQSWEQVPGGYFRPDSASLTVTIDQNNQLLRADVGGAGARLQGDCDPVRDLLLTVAESITAQPSSLRP